MRSIRLDVADDDDVVDDSAWHRKQRRRRKAVDVVLAAAGIVDVGISRLEFFGMLLSGGDRRYCHRCVMSIVVIFIGIVGPNPFINLILMLLFLLFLLGMIVNVTPLIKIKKCLLRQNDSFNLLHQLCQCRELSIGIKTTLFLSCALAFYSRLLPAICFCICICICICLFD